MTTLIMFAILKRGGNVETLEMYKRWKYFHNHGPLLSMGTITQSSGGEPSLNVTFIFIPLLP